MSTSTAKSSKNLTFNDFKNEVLSDYKLALISRECSLVGRKEVLMGKAKFGIFGSGKEIPQLAMAKVFKKGDYRSGYYRDQTFMMAIGALTPQQFFAGLYAHSNIKAEPSSAGRQMNGHFATHFLDENGNWLNQSKQYNISADISPTAGQMSRLVGLAQASKVYKQVKDIPNAKNFSINGNEIAWGTIGNASTSEGVFFEAVNAAGVLQIPMVISVWDDNYGISVPAKYQTTKESISAVLNGFKRDKNLNGYEIFTVKGWNYTQLIDVYQKAEKVARNEHVPVLIHVEELTQPQGHSTSGSHERYKSKERLEWENEFDCNVKMREWILNFDLKDNQGQSLKLVDNETDLINIEKAVKKEVSEAKRAAWFAYLNPIRLKQKELLNQIAIILNKTSEKININELFNYLKEIDIPLKKDILSTARQVLTYLRNEDFEAKTKLQIWISDYINKEKINYSAYLYSETEMNPVNVKEVKPIYQESKSVDGRVILRDNFEILLNNYKEIIIYGEDTGKIGDVNQGLEGLQQKFGIARVFDTGIRENTIIGQGIGMALRGLRPIAEVQYLDYILYAIQILSDDLSTLHYRSFGRQKAPLIVRTRGHRLEGIWHSGSPLGGIINLVRGLYVLVPRNMTKAAGFYNTLLEGDVPALVIENLNGYRTKEKMPLNLEEIRTPIGQVETIKVGTHITLVSYGATLHLVEEATKRLSEVGIEAELIDAQSLLPFDKNNNTVKSLIKTNRLAIIDEDVPGGASAYLLDCILNKQNAYQYLDSKPITITAKAHRPAYGTDGDYFSKPSVEDIFEQVYAVMNESDPNKYKALY